MWSRAVGLIYRRTIDGELLAVRVWYRRQNIPQQTSGSNHSGSQNSNCSSVFQRSGLGTGQRLGSGLGWAAGRLDSQSYKCLISTQRLLRSMFVGESAPVCWLIPTHSKVNLLTLERIAVGRTGLHNTVFQQCPSSTSAFQTTRATQATKVREYGGEAYSPEFRISLGFRVSWSMRA